MTTITISIPDDHLKRLQGIADRFGIRIDELVLAGIEQLLSQPDETFQNAADYVLKKNAELYRRLS
jgi:predicted transcriptional regulator